VWQLQINKGTTGSIQRHQQQLWIRYNGSPNARQQSCTAIVLHEQLTDIDTLVFLIESKVSTTLLQNPH
jgi:hypothetical protein